MNKLLSSTAGLLALGLTTGAWAQKSAPPPPPPPDAPCARQMHPHDEMAMPSPEERFKELDTNKDGSISLDEFRAGMAMHMQRMREHMHHGEHADHDAHHDMMPADHPPMDKPAPAK